MANRRRCSSSIRAVIASPKLILADEPTGNLHSAQGKEIMELFKKLNDDGTTIVQVTHSETNAQYGNRIINLADVGAERAWPGYIPYAISKAGVVMLTRGLAAALAPRIQVNAVGPGAVLLPEDFPRESKRRLRAKIPMGRLGHPDDVAAAVRFFATCPTYITGQVLYVDGGATAV